MRACTVLPVALLLVTAAYVPGNGIKARLHHPQVLAVKTWALAHLLANNTLADLLLTPSADALALEQGDTGLADRGVELVDDACDEQGGAPAARAGGHDRGSFRVRVGVPQIIAVYSL